MSEPFSFDKMKLVLDAIIRTCRFYGMNSLPTIDVSLTIGIKREVVGSFRECIKEKVEDIFVKLLEENFCQLTIYFQVIDNSLTDYDIDDFCVYISAEGLIPFL